jgi:hypothetical protein
MRVRMVDTAEEIDCTPAKAQELITRGDAVPVAWESPETAARTVRPVPAVRPDVETR